MAATDVTNGGHRCENRKRPLHALTGEFLGTAAGRAVGMAGLKGRAPRGLAAKADHHSVGRPGAEREPSRLAVAHAIDREAIVGTIVGGQFPPYPSHLTHAGRAGKNP